MSSPEDAQRALFRWFEENNPGGHDFGKPPPREMLVAAFPEEDEERVAYLMRKPNRIYEIKSVREGDGMNEPVDVFVVMQEGVYRHDIAGVYLDEPSARAAAEAAIRAEKDDYHSFCVVRMVVGKPGEHPICEVRRRDERRWDAETQVWHLIKSSATFTEHGAPTTST